MADWIQESVGGYSYTIAYKNPSAPDEYGTFTYGAVVPNVPARLLREVEFQRYFSNTENINSTIISVSGELNIQENALIWMDGVATTDENAYLVKKIHGAVEDLDQESSQIVLELGRS